MFSYKLTDTSRIQRSDGVSFPADVDCNEYLLYQEWLLLGNTPFPADSLSVETVIAGITADVQKHLDDFARTRGYDSILSACTYASSLVPKFKAEGQYCVAARDDTWAAGYTLMADVQSGVRTMPTPVELLAALPTLTWPV